MLLTKNEIEKRRDEEFCNVIVICHAIDLSEAANLNLRVLLAMTVVPNQGCISCGILVSRIRARGVSSEHMENMEMFSCSPT